MCLYAEVLNLMEPVGGGCLTCESKKSLRALRTSDTPHFFLRPRSDTCAPCDSSPSPPPPPPPSPPPPPTPPSPPPKTVKGLSADEIKNAIDAAKAAKEEAKQKREAAKTKAEEAAKAAKAAKEKAATKKAAADATRDRILARINDSKKARLAKIAADAAIAGIKVQTLQASVTADNETEACDSTLATMKLTAADAACQVSSSAAGTGTAGYKRRRGRSLAQTSSSSSSSSSAVFAVEIVVDPASEVDAAAAEKNLEASGVDVVVVQQAGPSMQHTISKPQFVLCFIVHHQ